MNLRSVVIVENIKNDRLYRLEIPVGAPYTEAHEASLELADAVVQMSKQAEEAAKAQAALEPELVEEKK